MIKQEVTPFDTPGETPGGEDMIEEVNLDHEYYKFSMKIIELILFGKEKAIPQMGLDIQVILNEVYYEEPLEDRDFQRDIKSQYKK